MIRIIRMLFSRINKMWLLMGAAILLGLVATWVTTQYLKVREQRIEAEAQKRATGGATVAVVVPVKNLPKGTVIDGNLVAARDVVADTVYEETVLAEDFGKVAGLKLSRPVEKGRPLRRSDLDIKAKEFAESLPEGMRAITIDVDEINSVAQMVRVGNRVDLMLIVPEPGEGGGGGQQVISLLQRMKIIATGQNAVRAQADAPAAQGAAPQRYSNVTFEVTPEEAARITLAQQMGSIRIVLRNEEDQLIEPLAKVNTQTLLRGYAGPSARKRGGDDEVPIVEFIIGGKGSGGIGQTVNVNLPSMFGAAPPPAAAPAPAAPVGQMAIPGYGNIPVPTQPAGTPAAR